MSEYSKEQVILSLKDMQSEITAIRYYSNKLSSLKKQIDTSSIDKSSYDTESASRLTSEKETALASQKAEPVSKKRVFDILLFIPFLVFSVILMVMLFPGSKMPLPISIINWIVLGYGLLLSLFFAAKSTTALRQVYDSLKKSSKYIILASLGVSVIAYVIDGILRPIFFITICPILFGYLILMAKTKENKRLAACAATVAHDKLSAKYDRMILEAQNQDAAEYARYEADIKAERQEKHQKHAPVIAECTKALTKHKAKFNEVNILPAEILKKDMGVVDSLLKIFEEGKAETLNEALAIWKKSLLTSEDDFAKIYVSAAIRRREGWGSIRNMMYLDCAKVGAAEAPYKVIKVVPGIHSLFAKVQLNYGGQSHYPQSEPIELTLSAGEVAYVKFFVSGNPTVQYRICRNMDEFMAEL
jgi:hypothetical protein